MASVLIVYGSTIGNTGYVAESVGKIIEGAGHSVEVKNVSTVTATDLCTPYDAVLFGCSTWGDDEVELQDDFVPLFESFSSINAKGKKVAVFGCGDSSYTYFCGAVDAIEQSLSEQGANVVAGNLKIDGDPQPEGQAITDWAMEVIQAL